jgi:hypothetical protein
MILIERLPVLSVRASMCQPSVWSAQSARSCGPDPGRRHRAFVRFNVVESSAIPSAIEISFNAVITFQNV